MPRRGKQSHQMQNNERKWFHVVEFSKGKPNEISFSVLDKLSAGSNEKKSGLRGRFGSGKGIADTLTPEDFAYLNNSRKESQDKPTVKKYSKEKSSRKSRNQIDGSLTQRRSIKQSNSKNNQRIQAKHTKVDSRKNQPSRIVNENSAFEIKKRKRNRKIVQVFSVLVIVAICVGLAGFGINTLYQKHIEEMTNIELLQEGLNNIEKADETIVSIDNFFNTPYDDNTVQTAQKLCKSIPNAKEALSKANEYATRANEGLDASTEDKQAAEYALKTIVSRETLLDVSEKIMEEDIVAKQTISSLQSADSNISKAEQLLRQSADIIADTTNDNVNKSTEYTNEAKLLLESSKALCQVAVSNYGEDIAGVYINYINKRIESCESALSSNEAILIQDKQTAESYNEQYNTQDKEAAEIGKAFEKSFYQPIINAYDTRTKSLKDQYQSLRSDIAINDGHLRSYLGIDTNS